MPDVTGGAIIGGASLLGNIIGGVSSSRAASNAADVQSQAAEQNNALQQQIYEQNAGKYDVNKASVDTSFGAQDYYSDVYRQATQDQKAYIQDYMNTLSWGGQQTYPFIQAGQRGVEGYENLLKDPSSITSTPGYQFRLGEGTKALERGAAARSGALGGAAQKALLKYGQEYGSNEYSNALKNYLPIIQAGQTGLSQLQGMYGLQGNAINQYGNMGGNYLNMANLKGNQGQTYAGMANAFSGAGTNYANSSNANNIYGANAQASGNINQANALTGGLQSGMNNALMGYYMGNYGGFGGGNNQSYFQNQAFDPYRY